MYTLKRSEGFALFIAILVMAIVMLFLGASLLLSRVDTKITSNFKLGTQALEVADAGLLHALKLLEPQNGWDFNDSFTCQTPPCDVISNSSFPSAPGFTYSVTVEDDPNDPDQSVVLDGNNLVVLVSTANGPSDSKRQVQAYVKRSSSNFTPPSALYINASSATIWGDDFFDDDSLQRIIGNDTNPVDLLDGNDDTSGPNPSLLGIATTSSAVKDDLITSAQKPVNVLHNDILGVGAEPSIGTTTDVLNVNKIADNFFNESGAVKYLDGLETRTDLLTCLTSPCQLCTSSSPCLFGTASTPQITYIRENTNPIRLRGHVRGYGVLVVEGRTTIGGDFRFKGLVVHKRSDLAHYIRFDNRAWVYGGVLFGSTDGNVTLRIEDDARLFYSSDALAIVESNWGSLLPKPPQVSAWIDK